jgi:hypothetical protein
MRRRHHKRHFHRSRRRNPAPPSTSGPVTSTDVSDTSDAWWDLVLVAGGVGLAGFLLYKLWQSRTNASANAALFSNPNNPLGDSSMSLGDASFNLGSLSNAQREQITQGRFEAAMGSLSLAQEQALVRNKLGASQRRERTAFRPLSPFHSYW